MYHRKLEAFVIFCPETMEFYAEDKTSGGYMFWTKSINVARIFTDKQQAKTSLTFWFKNKTAYNGGKMGQIGTLLLSKSA